MHSDQLPRLEVVVECLKHSIEDAQGTIRAYDMKANSLGVLLTVALGLTNYTLLQTTSDVVKIWLVASWAIGLLTLVLLGIVLHPISNPVAKVKLGDYVPLSTYYTPRALPPTSDTVDALAARALCTDWVYELTYEKMKLAAIRDYKHVFFQWSVRCSGLTLLFICLSVLTYAWETQ